MTGHIKKGHGHFLKGTVKRKEKEKRFIHHTKKDTDYFLTSRNLQYKL